MHAKNVHAASQKSKKVKGHFLSSTNLAKMILHKFHFHELLKRAKESVSKSLPKLALSLIFL